MWKELEEDEIGCDDECPRCGERWNTQQWIKCPSCGAKTDNYYLAAKGLNKPTKSNKILNELVKIDQILEELGEEIFKLEKEKK